MTRLAAADDARFSVSTLEVDRDGPSYTYETLELLARRESGYGAGVRDGGGRRPRARELARARAGGRAGAARRRPPLRRLRRRGGRGDAQPRLRRERATMLEMPQFGVSSSAVRERAAGGPAAALPGARSRSPASSKRRGSTRERREEGGDGVRLGALARRLAELADSKGATEIVVLDMRELVSYTDYLAICTARNERQAKAIVDEVKLRLKNEDGPAARRDRRRGRGGLDRARLPRCGAARLHRARPGSATSSRTSGGRPPGWISPFPQDDVRGHLYGAAHG